MAAARPASRTEPLNPELLSAVWSITILCGAAWRLRTLVLASGVGRRWIPWLFACCLLTLVRMSVLFYRHLWSSEHVDPWVIPVVVLTLSLFIVCCFSMLVEFVEAGPLPTYLVFVVGALLAPLASIPLLRFDAGYGSRIAPIATVLAIPFLLGSVYFAVYLYKRTAFEARRPMIWGCTIACWAVCASACYDAFLVQQTGAAGVFTTGWVQSIALIVIMLIAEGLLTREFVQRADERERAEIPVEAQSRLFATVSHELRTPLSSIIGLQEALSNRLAPAGQLALVKGLGQAALRLARLIDGVVAVERFALNRQRLDEKPFTLSRLFHQAEGDLQQRVSWSLSGPLDQVVVGDDRRFRQALEFLCYELSAYAGAEPVQAEVRGKRVSQDVTEVSFRLVCRSSKSQAGERPPLEPLSSLSIARRLFRLLGVELTSETDASGALTCQATFQLPSVIGRVELTETPREPTREIGTREARVLVVDDNAMNRRVLRLLMEQTGCDLIEASSGAEAIRRAKEGEFESVLIDLHMPGMTGLDVAAELRRHWQEVGAEQACRLVAWSADLRPEMIASAFASGFDRFLPKPYSREELFQALEFPLGTPDQEDLVEAVDGRQASEFLLALVGGDEALAEELVEEFESTWRMAHEQLVNAYERADWQEVQALAHRQRGGCLSLGLNEPAATAGRLQVVAGEDHREETYSLLLRLRTQCEAAGRLLRRSLQRSDQQR
ncbi:MAG: hypothetical protein CMH55_05725 [Myxococcales bacterium]|nr:hypothetical protein [Myxococcales bacterium]